MNNKTFSTWGVLGGFFLLALSQPAKATDELQARRAKSCDIMARLHRTNLAEINFADLAEIKANSAQVREYAQSLKKDHQAADQRLMNLAEGKDMATVLVSERNQQESDLETAQRTRLRGLSGPAFDRAFIKIMQENHRIAAQMVSRSLQRVPEDSPLHKLLADMLPTFQRQEETAAQLGQGRESVRAR